MREPSCLGVERIRSVAPDAARPALRRGVAREAKLLERSCGFFLFVAQETTLRIVPLRFTVGS